MRQIWFRALISQRSFRWSSSGARASAIVAFACAFVALVAPASALAVGSVSGTVTEEAAGHAPIDGVRVCALELVEEEFFGNGELGVDCELTDSNGDYTISGLAEGEYVVEYWPGFEGLNYSYEYYDDKSSPYLAELLEVTTAALTGIDAELAEGGEIEGTVVSEVGGGPVPGIFVCAEKSESPWYFECQVTDAAGEYTLPGLPEGEYWLEFYPGEQNFNFQYRSGVPVTVGAVTQGDATLQPGATITGTVSDAVSHVGLGEVEVCAIEVPEFEFGRCAETNSIGGYGLTRLQAGSYKVEFFPYSGLYPVQFYNGKSTFATADVISLGVGATRGGVDAALLKKGTSLPPSLPPRVVVPVLGNPVKKAPHCKKAFRKRKVKGKVRCVKHKKHHHRKHHARGRALVIAARLR